MKKAIVFSDTQCGALNGLMAPKDYADLTVVTQKPVYEWWEKEVKELGKIDIAVCNGDAIDGEGKRDTIGHLTTNTKEQRNIFKRAVEVVKAKQWYFTYGTPYHVTGSEDWEENLANDFNAPIKDILYLDIEGHKCRFRHHAGRSDTAYCQGTQLFKEAVRDTLLALDEETDPAKYLFSSHVHYYYVVGNAKHIVYSTPCLQTPGSVYARKLSSYYYDLGFLEIQADKNDFRVIPHICPIKFVRKREYIKA